MKTKECYALLPIDGSLIRIVEGESGYYPVKRNDQKIVGQEARQLADELNQELLVCPAERERMFNGSMFGWDTEGAKNPAHKINAIARLYCEK